ncbi:MAG: glycosyltransferase family 2 protein [Desulfarculaceae bacterium]|nr:glycosyltransferase family 2 protein [Desulfarculaceae bacterium]
MGKISVYIIAFNEGEKIRPALESVAWADEVVVADSYSTDNTCEIAELFGARVEQIPFKGFGALRNDAMALCSYEWIFSLDSDERCTREAKKEIQGIVQSENALDAYYVPRKNYFMGKWIKHSGFWPDFRQPQLFRKGVLKFENDPVHERYQVISDRDCGYMKSTIVQIPYTGIDEIVRKANRYSTLGAEKLEKDGERPSMLKALLHGFWAFFSLYVLKLGFLDGWRGFIIGFANFEGTFYKYAKLYFNSAYVRSTDTNGKSELE